MVVQVKSMLVNFNGNNNSLFICVMKVPFSDLDADTKQNLWPVFHKWYNKADKFQVTSSYGLFRR